MKKKTYIIIMLSLLLVVSDAVAYKRGDLELTLGGSGSSDNSFDNSVINFEAGLGIFLTENFEGI